MPVIPFICKLNVLRFVVIKLMKWEQNVVPYYCEMLRCSRHRSVYVYVHAHAYVYSTATPHAWSWDRCFVCDFSVFFMINLLASDSLSPFCK